VELRRDILRAVNKHLATDVRMDADGPERWSLRFANLELDLGELTSEAALRARLARIAGGVQEHAKGELEKITRVPVNARLSNTLRPFVTDNVSLITKMTKQMTDRMRNSVSESVQAQMTQEELAARIQEDFGFTKARSKLIARDQTLRYNSQVTQQVHREAGITRFLWNTSHDERVRGTPGGKWPRGHHYNLDGKIFSYSDPPVVDLKTGRRALPGADFQCRCVAVPFTDDLLYSDD
jgi:SPP1 gp7 family putative phage head morphogenesis protein